jgi:hypothetical protein
LKPGRPLSDPVTPNKTCRVPDWSCGRVLCLDTRSCERAWHQLDQNKKSVRPTDGELECRLRNLDGFGALPHGGHRGNCMVTSSPTTPFETFTNIIQFYPRLTASIAFGAMSAFGRMLPSSRSVSEATTAPTQSPGIMASSRVERPKAINRRPNPGRARPSKKSAKRRNAA